MDNSMKIEFLSKSSNEAFARVAVAAFVSQLDPTIEELSEIKTAVSEGVTNAIIHGYDNKNGLVEVTCTLTDRLVTIIIKDNGKGIADIAQAMEPLYTSCPEMERSGLGFTVMQTFSDSIDVVSELGKGTTITLLKRLSD